MTVSTVDLAVHWPLRCRPLPASSLIAVIVQQGGSDAPSENPGNHTQPVCHHCVMELEVRILESMPLAL